MYNCFLIFFYKNSENVPVVGKIENVHLFKPILGLCVETQILAKFYPNRTFRSNDTKHLPLERLGITGLNFKPQRLAAMMS